MAPCRPKRHLHKTGLENRIRQGMKTRFQRRISSQVSSSTCIRQICINCPAALSWTDR